jgi:hypothetical protein
MTDADDSAFPADDKLAELEAAERRLDEAIPALAATVGAEPEHEAALLEELKIAARSYWNLWQLPRDRPDFQPSVAKRKLASRRRSIRKVTDSVVRGLPDPYFRLVEAVAGPELLAKFQEVNDAMAAAIHAAEHVAEFAAPSSTDRCMNQLFINLASIFRAATGMQPTHTWNDVKGDFTSPFDRFVREAAATIDPDIATHGSVAEAIRRIWAKHTYKPDDPRARDVIEVLEQAAKQRAGGRVARRAKPPS